ncbi:MAG: YgjV family protein [Clostridiales bacterium]|nr:YgjV family protein [Clostridiales bacterium]
MTPFEILVQAIGFVGIALNILSVQFNKHWQIMLLKTLGSMTFVLQYILLGAWVGMVMDLIGSIRNVIFTLNVKNGRSNKSWIIAFSIITFIAGLVTIITTWDKSIGYASNWSKDPSIILIIAVSISIISIVAKLLTTIAYGFKDPHRIRMVNIPSNACWVVYNLVAFSIAGVINDLMCLGSIVIAEIRFRKKKTAVPTLETAEVQTQDNDK